MELHTIANVILINSRIPADKTLVLTDKSYKPVGISQKKNKCFKKRCKMIGGSDRIKLFQMVKTNYIDILWCHKEFRI
jgi:hypothetical protein